MSRPLSPDDLEGALNALEGLLVEDIEEED